MSETFTLHGTHVIRFRYVSIRSQKICQCSRETREKRRKGKCKMKKGKSVSQITGLLRVSLAVIAARRAMYRPRVKQSGSRGLFAKAFQPRRGDKQ